MDTKTSLMVLLVVGCILYFSYSAAAAKEEENKTLRRTLETFRFLTAGSQHGRQPDSHQPPPPQKQQSPGPSPSPGSFLNNAAKIPRNLNAEGAIGQRPSSKSPFPPRESDDDGGGMGDASQYGIGAGLADDPMMSYGLGGAQPGGAPQLPSYA